ncbi:MAG: YqjK-like family protein [Rhodoferax sp.]
MSLSNFDLVERQQRLLARSALLRESLASQSGVLQRPLALADRVAQGLQWLYKRPQWSAAAITVLVVTKPSRILIWGSRMWWIWKSVQKVQKLLNR